MKCPLCNIVINEKSNFCSNCGCCVSSSMKATPIGVNKPSTSRRKLVATRAILWSIIGLLAVLLIICLATSDTGDSSNAAADKITGYEQKISDLENQIEIYKNQNNIVCLPDDGSYLYHLCGCINYDHDLNCKIVEKEVAESYGCSPCPYCFGE